MLDWLLRNRMQWYYMAGGVQQGPVDDAALLELVRQGVIGDDTLTYHEGSPGWQPWPVARTSHPAFSSPPALPPRAWVTPTLVVINVLVFVAMCVSGVSVFEPKIADLIRWGADFGPLTKDGQWWRVVTSMFIHIGIIHIAMNMFVLWTAGIIIERLFGSAAFTVLYVLAGVGGSLASLAWQPFTVSAGASGAVFGLFGGLLGYLVTGRKFVPAQTVTALGKYAGTFLAYNLVYGFARSGVDIAAHVGGLGTGFLLGIALAAPAAAPGARLRRTVIAAVAGAVCLAVAFARLPARSVMAGSDMVRYSDKVTRPEAQALARYLKQSGFFQDHGVTVELSRRADGAFVSFSVKDGFWNNGEYLDSIESLGAEIATAAVNPPLTIELRDPQGVSRRQIRITRRVVHVGKKDLVYYEGSATGEDAKALGHALQENGFFLDTGRAIALSKGADGTVITLNITAAAWGNPQYQKSAIEFGRQIAPAVGGVPITLRLAKPLTMIEKVANAKPETVDLPIR
jgi:membrane associated rhomboid family serine protease